LKVTDVSSATKNTLALTDAQAEYTILQAILISESRSSHPLAAAIVEWAKENPLLLQDHRQDGIRLEAKSIAEISGKGIQASFTVEFDQGSQEIDFAIGNERLMRDIGMKKLRTDEETILNRWKSQAKSVVISAYRVKNSSSEDEGFHSGYCLALADALRPEATDVIQQLKTSGFRVHMLSGDNKQTARAVAAQLGFEDENVIAEVLPEEKGKHIARLQEGAMRSVDASHRRGLTPFKWLGQRRGGNGKPTVMFVGGKCLHS